MSFIGSRRALYSSIPKWVLPKSSLDLDFQGNRGYAGKRQQSIEALLSCSRAGAGMAQNLDGSWSTFATNTLRRTDRGLLIEEARTNSALWGRNFTNAAWVKVNITAALNQTGIDNSLNSASSLTATAINATALQTLSLASASRTLSFWVKRLTGIGAVSISQDGVSWTAITVTAAWSLVQLTATQLNPVIGFQIATSGDAIAVDFAQIEAGAFATSPILTTTAAVTRAADQIQLTSAPAIAAVYAAKSAFDITKDVIYSSFNRAWNIAGDGTGSASHFFPPTTTTVAIGSHASQVVCTIGGGGVHSGTLRTALSFDGVTCKVKTNGGTEASGALVWSGTAGNIFLGSGGSSNFLNGYLLRLALSLIASNYGGMTA